MASGTVELAKLEALRGRQEITENVVSYRTGVVFMAIALAFAAADGDRADDPPRVHHRGADRLATLVVALVASCSCSRRWRAFAWQGITRIQRQFTPDETIEGVKEDIEWAKRLLRRG